MNLTDDERRALATELDRVMEGVLQFGSALNAMDHGGDGVAQELQGHELIRTAFARAPSLDTLLPNLAAKLRAGESVADDGFRIRDEVDRARALVAGGATGQATYGMTGGRAG